MKSISTQYREEVGILINEKVNRESRNTVWLGIWDEVWFRVCNRMWRGIRTQSWPKIQ